MGCLYMAENLVNGKRYIGRTKATMDARRRSHEKDAARGSLYLFHKAIRKYGADSFRWSKLMEEDRAAQETVERARASGRWMESAAVQIKIIELNQELAEKQAWAERSPLPEWLAPVAPILELTPIE